MNPKPHAARSLFEPTVRVAGAYSPDSDIVLCHGDSRDFIRTIPDESIQLVVTSPPYNIGKSYETRTAIETYLGVQELVIDELIRTLRTGGSICWQVGNFVDNGEIYPLDIFYYRLFKARGLKLRNRIVWHFEHGLHASRRFSGRYETILWFTKGDEYTFNLDPVRIASKYPGKTHFKGPNKGMPSGNPLGKNPSDLWKFISEEWVTGIWCIPNVKANHPEKTIHPCQFPVELVERCVLAMTNPGDRILDPYCGVGSSLIAGIKHDRKVVGCDKEAEYITAARGRIDAYDTGTLALRPLGKPVHKPTGNEKVSRRPSDWGKAE